MAVLYRATLEQSCLPTEWENANVVPIFKKNDRSCSLNYRPVSLTNICCKLLEHIIYSNIFEHLHKYNILCSHQHGFRTGHSCETQLLTILDDLAYNLNSGFQTDLILRRLSTKCLNTDYVINLHIMVLKEPLLDGYRISLPIEHNK